jgi:hypothetical protein
MTSGTTPVGKPYPSVTQAEIDAHTVQALVELVYVRAANDILGDSLVALESALNVTQSVLRLLSKIQDLHNKITVQGKSAFGFNFKSTGVMSWSTNSAGVAVAVSVNASLFMSEYNKAASAYFGKSIDPIFVFSSATAPGYAAYEQALQTLKTQLGQEISVLARMTPVGSDGNENSLLSTLRKVYGNMPATFSYSTVQQWALDKYNVHGSTNVSLAGQIQSDITFAITAAQSLNDAQKEKVRRYMFIFQEYYQSASAVLSKINTIVEQMAQKISSS